jgi:hypothetical protein
MWCGAAAAALQKAPGRPTSRLTLPLSDRHLALMWQRLRLPLPVEWITGRLDLYHSPDFVLPPVRRARTLLTVHDLSFMRHPECSSPALYEYLINARAALGGAAPTWCWPTRPTRSAMSSSCWACPPSAPAWCTPGSSRAFAPCPTAPCRAGRPGALWHRAALRSGGGHAATPQEFRAG